MSDEASERLANFLAILDRLPVQPGITWHGSGTDSRSTDVITTPGVLATSRDPRVATENFSVPFALALVSTSGRLIAPLSAHPEEQEVVVLPGTTFVRVAAFEFDDPRLGVTVYSEINPDQEPGATSALPQDAESLERELRVQLVLAGLAEPLQIASPGKFLSGEAF
jgi:hypothetical protein